MEYKQVKYILDENAQLKAEIERLRAAILDTLSVIQYRGHNFADKAYSILANTINESQQQPEPPQESPTPAELGNMAGKAEAVEEPLKVRILRTLNKRPFLNSDELSDSLGVARWSIVLQLRKMHDHASIYALIAFSNFWDGYELTHAGRDYLASLDKQQAYIIPVRDDR